MSNPVSISEKTGSLLVVIVLILCVVQFVTKSAPEEKTPGLSRGDLVLTREALPENIAAWQMVDFQPPLPPIQLPEGQYWWTHSWIYREKTASAVVSFDQLGLNHWHELTHCYQGLGWQLTRREVVVNSDSGAGESWEYVVAELSKLTGERALLIFSTFYEDGSPTEALRIGLDHDWNERPDLATVLLNRLHPASPQPSHTRALQCQVFGVLPESSSERFSENCTDLHLTSRIIFRQKWLKSIEASMPRNSTVSK